MGKRFLKKLPMAACTEWPFELRAEKGPRFRLRLRNGKEEGVQNSPLDVGKQFLHELFGNRCHSVVDLREDVDRLGHRLLVQLRYVSWGTRMK